MKEMRYVGPLLEAPLNRLVMLRDYIDPEERNTACPNQDVVYGLGLLGLDVSPVVIQVPDFGERFWVYQIVDLRTDSFVQLGKMYRATPGFYLLAGPNWRGEVPKGITRVFQASTNTGPAAPRVFQDDTPEDKRAIQSVLTGIVMYPLYFYQDLDAAGTRLNSANRYTVTFAKDQTPPVNGFWSLSIYNEHHFFVANPINRFSVGTKNKDLRLAADGSLTIYVQADAPADPVQRANWLPAPKGDFSLYVRAYWPKPAVTEGSWTPPAVLRT
jgi:hypothetical protein